jgi:hypothetical protein
LVHEKILDDPAARYVSSFSLDLVLSAGKFERQPERGEHFVLSAFTPKRLAVRFGARRPTAGAREITYCVIQAVLQVCCRLRENPSA